MEIFYYSKKIKLYIKYEWLDGANIIIAIKNKNKIKS